MTIICVLELEVKVKQVHGVERFVVVFSFFRAFSIFF